MRSVWEALNPQNHRVEKNGFSLGIGSFSRSFGGFSILEFKAVSPQKCLEQIQFQLFWRTCVFSTVWWFGLPSWVMFFLMLMTPLASFILCSARKCWELSSDQSPWLFSLRLLGDHTTQWYRDSWIHHELRMASSINQYNQIYDSWVFCSMLKF